MDTKDKLVTLEDLKVVHDGVDALETRMESAESEISDTVKKSTGGTFSGDIAVDKADGTTSTQGWSSVSIGNNKATGTAGNSGGDLQIYGRTAYKTEFISPPNSPTANRVITIPDASGTVALTSDIFNATNISDYFTLTASGVSLNGTNVCLKVGPTIILRLNFVKTNSSNFEAARITLGTLASGVRPLTARYVVGAASNGINSYLNRSFGLVIQTDGVVIADNYYNSDVKQFYINVEYTCA